MVKLNTVISNDLMVGDFILFQEYNESDIKDEFSISKPIYAIFLGFFQADQTVGFNYVRVPKYWGANPEIESHYEWDDYTDLLGSWSIGRPHWNEILKAYRNYNPNKTIKLTEIEW